MDSNRRHFSRIHFNTDGKLLFPGGECPVEIIDLSLKGAMLQLAAPAPLQTGQRCTLRLSLAANGAGIGMEAEVAHVEGQIVGLRCIEIDLDSITHLRRLVELNLGDDSLLHRELEALVKS
ncbi:MAG: PilZ domain-containing protein [Azovibrio sp.]|uniref:PilZ domain-containing protein n=1 Tax=Azovibrio sp. TaxID=1872673 RepID=UPI003C726E48